ncbi:hypothetical protein MTO96_039463 [Rhipicephalus appendiculatus]
MSAMSVEPAAALESLEDVARRELRETPEVKQTALNDLRQLISDEPSFHCPTDDAFLVKFLRARKYNTQAAFKNIKKYFTVRTEHPEIFEALTPSCILFDVVCRKHRLITVSRHTDPMGRIAVMLKMGAWNTDICKLTDFFRAGLVVFEHLLLGEEAQVRGVVLNIDLKGLNVYHLLHYMPSMIRILISLAQVTENTSEPFFRIVCPGLKGIYVINNPPIFDFLFAIAKTFIKAKLLKRIRLFGHDLEELHKLMPDDVIPEEHGGTNESYDYDAFEKELKSSEGYFQALGSYGYCETQTKSAHESNGVLTDDILSSEEWVHL